MLNIKFLVNMVKPLLSLYKYFLIWDLQWNLEIGLAIKMLIHNEIKSYLNIDESMYITKCMKIQHLDTRYRPKATWPMAVYLAFKGQHQL